MIQKVLIAEDHESANLSLQRSLEDLQIKEIDYVYYCDDAFQRIQLSLGKNTPYDLLITDLIFEDDGRVQQIKNGTSLISKARILQPDLKILVFSAEHKPTVIESLFRDQEIDGYVRKARNDAKELREAIDSISRNQRYFPRKLQQLINSKNGHDFTPYDITIISLLADGMLMKEIPDYLNEHHIQPSGLSSVEKRFKEIKGALDFTNNEQLIAFCKDMGIF